MPHTTNQSRFSPAYLASKHAGTLFLCLALGLCAGVFWRTLVQPTRYRSEADVFYNLSHESTDTSFGWEQKIQAWNTLPFNQQDRDLLGSNLRFLVKLAATSHAEPDTDRFTDELASLAPRRLYSTAFLPNSIARFGPSFTVTRSDFAANLDFQTLALVIADLDPPGDAQEWNFSFFHEDHAVTMEDSLIVRPDHNDRYFRVFYYLYNITQPKRRMITPEEAWRVAVDEVADRLDREAQFPGGGGFGHAAKRELVREFAALPVLAANSLYHAFSWSHGDTDFRQQTELWAWRWQNAVAISATMRDAASGSLAAGMTLDLHPIAFPRDTMMTRIPPLVVSSLLAYIEKQETPAVRPDPVPVPVPQPEPAAQPEEETPEVAIVDVQPVVPTRTLPENTVIDREAERLRAENILFSEAKLRQTRIEREAAIRLLDTLRERDKILAADLRSARDRAERLADRLETIRTFVPAPDHSVPVETARLQESRDAVRARLAELLLTCTEEHPFVRKARRDLAAIEQTLAELEPDQAAEQAAEDRETRIRAAHMEWETADIAAKNLEERRRRTSGEIQNAARAIEALEQTLIEMDRELVALQAAPAPTMPAPEPVVLPVTAPPPPEPAKQPEPAAPASAESDYAVIQFAAVPQRISMFATTPSWEAPIIGALAGLALGLLYSLFRELTARRFSTFGEAQRMMPFRALAALPAFDAKTVRAAAAGMQGNLYGKKEGSLVFIPASVETTEPKPAARRGKIMPAKKHIPLSGWAFGLLFLGCAALVYMAGMPLLEPTFRLHSDINLPPAGAYDVLGAAATDAWGENP